MTTVLLRLSFLAAFLLAVLGGSPFAEAASAKTQPNQYSQSDSTSSGNLARVILAAHKFDSKKDLLASVSKGKSSAHHGKTKKLASKKHKSSRHASYKKSKSSKKLKHYRRYSAKKMSHKKYKKYKTRKRHMRKASRYGLL
jgi:hypothetical protein